jgi:hypothetical protein
VVHSIDEKDQKAAITSQDKQKEKEDQIDTETEKTSEDIAKEEVCQENKQVEEKQIEDSNAQIEVTKSPIMMLGMLGKALSSGYLLEKVEKADAEKDHAETEVNTEVDKSPSVEGATSKVDTDTLKVEHVSGVDQKEENASLDIEKEEGENENENDIVVKDDGKSYGAVDDKKSPLEDDKTDVAKEICAEALQDSHQEKPNDEPQNDDSVSAKEETVKTDIATEKDEVDDALGKDDKEEKSASDADDDKPSDKLDQEMQSTEVEAEPEPSSKPEREDDDTTSGVRKSPIIEE